MWIFSILCFFDVALQIPRYSWQQAPSLGMELRKLDAAICYCWCLFFNFPIISSVEWKQAGSSTSDFTPGQCLCWIQSPCSAGRRCQRCWHQSSQRVTQPALCCGFVLNYSNSPLIQGSGQQTSSAPLTWDAFNQLFLLDPEILCTCSPCCVFWDRGWMPALGGC